MTHASGALHRRSLGPATRSPTRLAALAAHADRKGVTPRTWRRAPSGERLGPARRRHAPGGSCPFLRSSRPSHQSDGPARGFPAGHPDLRLRAGVSAKENGAARPVSSAGAQRPHTPVPGSGPRAQRRLPARSGLGSKTFPRRRGLRRSVDGANRRLPQARAPPSSSAWTSPACSRRRARSADRSRRTGPAATATSASANERTTPGHQRLAATTVRNESNPAGRELFPHDSIPSGRALLACVNSASTAVMVGIVVIIR